MTTAEPATKREIPASERRVFGILLPHVLLAIGYYLSLQRAASKGDVGFLAMGLGFLIPVVLLVSLVATARLLPQRCRSRRHAFFVGCIVPVTLLLLQFIYLDANLP